MSSNYFSPQKSGDGAALFVSFSSKDAAVYLKLTKQTGEKSFKSGANCSVKLSEDEVGAFVHAIRIGGETKFYHTTAEGGVTTGTFAFYSVENEYKGKIQLRQGFGLTVIKNDIKYKVGFTLGAAERLSAYLNFSLNHIFSANYSLEVKEGKERAALKEKTGNKVENTVNVEAEDISDIPF